MPQVKTGKVPQRIYGTPQSYQNDDEASESRLPTHVPIIGLGCSSFSSFFSSGEEPLTVDTISRDHPLVPGWVETIRHAVLNRGINLLDTAPWYGHGTSEIVVGYALDTILRDDDNAIDDENNHDNTKPMKRKRTGSLPRNNMIINTKTGRYDADPLHQFDFSYDTTLHSVQRSIERMNCGYIDVLQLHDPEFAVMSPYHSSKSTNTSSFRNSKGFNLSTLVEETIPALIECRKRGLTKAIGITGYPLEVQHEILVKFNSNGGINGMVFDQSLTYCHCNLHDNSLFNDACFPSSNEGDGEECKISFAQFCLQSNVQLMAAAPLSMGLLTNGGPPEWHPALDSLKVACREAAKLCQSKGVNVSSLAVLFALCQGAGIGGVKCTLIGMKDMDEVDIAADLAMRFTGVDFDGCGVSDRTQSLGASGASKSVLNQILDAKEKGVLEAMFDENDGPFASVFKAGEYRWDGIAEGRKFWDLVVELKEKGR